MVILVTDFYFFVRYLNLWLKSYKKFIDLIFKLMLDRPTNPHLYKVGPATLSFLFLLKIY